MPEKGQRVQFVLPFVLSKKPVGQRLQKLLEYIIPSAQTHIFDEVAAISSVKGMLSGQDLQKSTPTIPVNLLKVCKGQALQSTPSLA